ncbi:helix-turn-helix domain-containing protein [Mesorhizobium sp. M1136]|uniref:helix-turn-helix domain-containing protein n=1 Tax=Mesorhizobium sp. M1136 TaxID=2957059 RepID=UPI00333C3966
MVLCPIIVRLEVPPAPRPPRSAEQGATLAEIADALKTTVRTVSRWRLNYAEFREALDLGRHKKAIGQTEAQLARAADAQRERDRLSAAKAAGEAAAREAALELKQLLEGAVANAEPPSPVLPTPSTLPATPGASPSAAPPGASRPRPGVPS